MLPSRDIPKSPQRPIPSGPTSHPHPNAANNNSPRIEYTHREPGTTPPPPPKHTSFRRAKMTPPPNTHSHKYSTLSFSSPQRPQRRPTNHLPLPLVHLPTALAHPVDHLLVHHLPPGLATRQIPDRGRCRRGRGRRHVRRDRVRRARRHDCRPGPHVHDQQRADAAQLRRRRGAGGHEGGGWESAPG